MLTGFALRNRLTDAVACILILGRFAKQKLLRTSYAVLQEVKSLADPFRISIDSNSFRAFLVIRPPFFLQWVRNEKTLFSFIPVSFQ
jgi:hypothetical protein